MKKSSIILLLIFSSVIFYQCFEESELQCSQSDWIGTYILESEEECSSDSTNQEEITFVDTIIFTSNEDPGKITWGMYQYDLQDCYFGNFKASLTLDNNNITYLIEDCSAQYRKID